MKTPCKRFCRGVLGFGLVLALGLTLCWMVGLRVNLTRSMPMGLYRTEPESAVQRGDLVSVCVPDRSELTDMAVRYLHASMLCPSGLQPVLKRVAAQPGDALRVDESGIWINGELWPDSAVRHEDSSGRLVRSFLESMPSVPSGMALVLGQHPGSFDSRYFGLAPLASCQKAIPILTF